MRLFCAAICARLLPDLWEGEASCAFVHVLSQLASNQRAASGNRELRASSLTSTLPAAALCHCQADEMLLFNTLGEQKWITSESETHGRIICATILHNREAVDLVALGTESGAILLANAKTMSDIRRLLQCDRSGAAAVEFIVQAPLQATEPLVPATPAIPPVDDPDNPDAWQGTAEWWHGWLAMAVGWRALHGQ